MIPDEAVEAADEFRAIAECNLVSEAAHKRLRQLADRIEDEAKAARN